MMHLWQFHGGIKLNGRKSLSCETPVIQANIPKFLVLPLLQHIGEPTEPIVQVGDTILKGQIIAHCFTHDCSLQMSAPIHAPTSGTVVAIEARPVPHPSGLNASCIVIETDGQDTWGQRTPLRNYTTLSSTAVREHIASAGIVGLGGAGFPSHLKLKPEGIDTLIINGAECEPYITCDDRLMREYPQAIITGAQILKHTLGGAKHCIIAIEDNKPAAYAALVQAAQGQSVEIIKVPTLYPTGGEKQLIYVLTGKEVARGQIPAHLGIVVHNVETTRAIYRAVQEGQPLISRLVTITGNGVEKPRNLEALFGTPMHDLINQCGRKPHIKRLVMGGPMMGLTLPNDELPIIKTTSCLIVSDGQDLVSSPSSMPCIRCGACAQVCPIQLLPQQLYWYANAKDFKKIQAYQLFDCIECGCCSYVCPSHIPLVGYYRYAKAEIRAKTRERQQANLAKQRYEFRQRRLEREKQEREAFLKQQRMAALGQKENLNHD